jgi:hypothetical protein
MRALVVYESMFGNTHQVATAIAEGLARAGVVVEVVPVAEATRDRLVGLDLLVVGGPTHAWSMSRPSTREGAAEAAAKSGRDLDPAASGGGIREWLAAAAPMGCAAAAFDTRRVGPALFTGRASRGIAAELREHGATLVVPPQSFLVTAQDRLQDGQRELAVRWGRQLAAQIAPVLAG